MFWLVFINAKKMIILSGGTGTPKLLVGLKQVFQEEELNIIVNTAEDVWVSGNLVCPDVDSVIYALAGQIDEDKWWGVKDDSFFTHTTLKRFDYVEQMMIGDKDRATHIIRSELLRRGETLTKTASSLATRFGLTANILPMTDDVASVSTQIITPEEKLHFQEFWIEKSGEPEVLDVLFNGIETVQPSKGVKDVLSSDAGEDIVLIGPSNPITSIGPILSMDGVRQMLTHKKVVAVSPIVGHNPVSGPAGKFMQAKGFEVSPYGVYRCYEDFLDVLLIDESDEWLADKEEVEVVKTDIIIRDDADSKELAMFIQELIGAM